MQLLNYLSWQSTWHFQNRKVTAVLFSDNRFPSPIGHNADKALWYIFVSFLKIKNLIAFRRRERLRNQPSGPRKLD